MAPYRRLRPFHLDKLTEEWDGGTGRHLKGGGAMEQKRGGVAEALIPCESHAGLLEVTNPRCYTRILFPFLQGKVNGLVLQSAKFRTC